MIEIKKYLDFFVLFVFGLWVILFIYFLSVWYVLYVYVCVCVCVCVRLCVCVCAMYVVQRRVVFNTTKHHSVLIVGIYIQRTRHK